MSSKNAFARRPLGDVDRYELCRFLRGHNGRCGFDDHRALMLANVGFAALAVAQTIVAFDEAVLAGREFRRRSWARGGIGPLRRIIEINIIKLIKARYEHIAAHTSIR